MFHVEQCGTLIERFCTIKIRQNGAIAAIFRPKVTNILKKVTNILNLKKPE